MLFTLLLAVALAQGPGMGVSKDTRACSAGIVDDVYNFMMAYFPVEEAEDDCYDRKCKCGTQARVTLSLSSSPSYNHSNDEVERRRQTLQGFGIHCVYAAGKGNARLEEAGTMTQEQIEAVFIGKLGTMSTYEVFMEYSTGLYTSDISSFQASLEAASVDYYSISWDSYISILVTPGGTIVHEVVGPISSAPKSLLEKAVKSKGSRFSFNYLGGVKGAPAVASGTMSALWVSRASTDITRDETYFKDVFGLSDDNFQHFSGIDPAGNAYTQVEVQMSDFATTKYRLIQPADTTTGDYSVSWWETYNNDVHDQWMTSATCGWDLMGDNHNAFDWINGFDQATIIPNADAAGYKYFCKDAGNDKTHCYLCTPFGYQIQLDGSYKNPPSYFLYTDQLCATYQEYC